MKKEVRDKFVHDLKTTAMQHIERKVKDYREVLANLARRLNG